MWLVLKGLTARWLKLLRPRIRVDHLVKAILNFKKESKLPKAMVFDSELEEALGELKDDISYYRKELSRYYAIKAFEGDKKVLSI